MGRGERINLFDVDVAERYSHVYGREVSVSVDSESIWISMGIAERTGLEMNSDSARDALWDAGCSHLYDSQMDLLVPLHLANSELVISNYLRACELSRQLPADKTHS